MIDYIFIEPAIFNCSDIKIKNYGNVDQTTHAANEGRSTTIFNDAKNLNETTESISETDKHPEPDTG